MVKTSKEANLNYLAKIVRLKGLRKHSNADRLQCVDIDFQTVITGLDAKDGDIYVYFPVESAINKDYLTTTNSFRKSLGLNADLENTGGFFEAKCRVKAVKLREEKSLGYLVPIATITDFCGEFNVDDNINVEFDTINGILMVEKYVVPIKGFPNKQGKIPKLSRLIDGQVKLHVSTEQLAKNIYRISSDDEINISDKTHGTSWWVANVKVKRYLSRFERLLQWLGVNISNTEYDHVYGSRRVVKNKSLDDPKQQDHFYGYDLWEDIKDQVKEHIPKGFTLYGEALGFTKDGAAIQKGYDYGCSPKEMKLEVYRITVTNADGFTIELSDIQIEEFCVRAGLTNSKSFHRGKAYWILPSHDAHAPDWNEKFIEQLREEYTEKDCNRCVNKVPAEGIVVRKHSLFNFEAYKLKSFRFLEKESISLDEEVTDMESEN